MDAAGQTAAFGVQEMLATGNPEQFQSALAQGAGAGLVLSVIGGMGKSTEWLLRNRKNMPARARTALAGAAEAVGFTASEIAEMQGGIWEFLKDPTAASWGDYTSLFAKNWLGILAARGMGARLGRPPTESLGFMRRISRAAVGEKVLEVKAGWQKAQEAVKGAVGKAKEKLTRKAEVSRGTEPWEAEISPELREQIREMGVEPRDLVRLAELQRRVEAGDEAAKQEFLDLERELDIREIRYGNAEPEEIEAELAGIREARQRAAKKILEETGTPEEMTKLGSYQQQRRYQMAEGAPPPIGAKDIVRESDIYLRMEGFEGDAVRTPHFKGRLSAAANRRLSKSVRGFFARNPNFVRWMGSSVMATRSHEFSHAVGEAAYGLGSRVLGGDALKEAREMLEGYGGAGKLKPELVFDEAWAEYHARMLLQEPGLNRKYPALTQVFNRILSAKPKVMAQFMDVHRMMRKFHDYGVIGQFEMRTRSLEDVPMTETQKRARKTREGGVVKRATRKLEEWFFEDVERLRHSLGRWADIAGVDVSKIPITMNILRTLEALRGSEAGTAAEFLERGVRFAVPGSRRSVGIKEILTAHIDTLEKKRAYQFYLEARRKLEMQKKGMVTGYPEEALLKIRDHYAKQLGGREMADALADATKSYWDSLIDWASSYGLLTPEEATNLIESWQTYVPFQRYHSMALESGLGKGGGLRRLRGGTEEIADPVEAMQSVTLNIIRQVNRHRATQALWDMIHRYDGLAGLARVLKPGNVPQEYQIEALIRAIKASEEIPAEKKAGVDWTLQQLKELLGEDVAASAVLFRRQVDLPNNRSIIMHRQNGRMQWLEVDPDVFHALAAVENPMSGGRAIAAMRTFTKAARVPVELVRYFATTINPEFALRNMFRDAALFPGYSKVPRSLLPWSGLYYWGRGVSRWLRASTDKDLAELMSLYRAMGGGSMTYYARQIRRLRGSEELLPKGARAPEPYTPRGMIMRARRVLEGTVGKMVDIGEQALRFEEFVEVYRDRAKTMPQAQAALEALEASKEVTINFTRAGLISRQLNELIPYFNASMQGTRRWIRAFSGAEGKKVQRTAFANAASTLGAMTLLQYLFHKDEDWFKDLNSWQRLTNYNFMLGDQVLTIPQPHFVGYAVSGVMDQLLSENKLTVRDLVDEGLQQLIFSHFALPSFLLPFMEWTTDYSFWRGRPLTPDWLEKSRLPSDQFNAYTAGWAKWAARTLNDYFPVVDWTPIKLENMVNQLTGSLPKNVERTIVGIGNSLGFELDEQRTELLDQIPVFSSLFRHTAHRGSYAVEQFYRRSDRLRQQKGSGQLDPREQQEYAVAEQLRSQLQAVRAMRDAGVLTQDEANRQQYEVVLPFMESFNR